MANKRKLFKIFLMSDLVDAGITVGPIFMFIFLFILWFQFYRIWYAA